MSIRPKWPYVYFLGWIGAASARPRSKPLVLHILNGDLGGARPSFAPTDAPMHRSNKPPLIKLYCALACNQIAKQQQINTKNNDLMIVILNIQFNCNCFLFDIRC